MVRRAYRQRSLVEVLLPDADKLWDATLRQIDALLDDDVLVDRVAEALARRHPQSRRRGRLGTPKARMKVLYQGLMGITRAVVRQTEAAVTPKGGHRAV